MNNDLISHWDENICQGHVNSEISTVITYFEQLNIEDISFIDIGANVGKYYDVLSEKFKIKNCVMYEGSRILSDFLFNKFAYNDNVEIYNYAISDSDKLTYFDESTIKYFLEKEDIDGLNLGLSRVSDTNGTPVQMRDIFGLLNERKDFFSKFNFIKIDTETVDYFILRSLKQFIKELDNKPLICFEHNYHNSMNISEAKEIYESFLSECGYIGDEFEKLSGDVILKPKKELIKVLDSVDYSKNTLKTNKTKIRVHNPTNEHTRYYRNYNKFWDDFTDHLKLYFDVEENRYFEKAHAERFPIQLQKSTTTNFMLLECEYIIENLENGEFVIMSISDDLSHAILNEKGNPFLKKVLVSQFDPKKIHSHTGEYMYKYSPWTYFISTMMDIEYYHKKRLQNKPTENKLYFRGTDLENRSILNFFDKDIITPFFPILQDKYYEDIIKHKISLSVDGRGEFCYRDIECFGLGIPIIRYEYLSKFYKELIPNYHYISLERPEDMRQYKKGNELHAKNLQKKYLQVLNDEDYLTYISTNARKYYEDNIFQKNKIGNTFNLLNLRDWL
jgi:FkbM family methyltransferase